MSRLYEASQRAVTGKDPRPAAPEPSRVAVVDDPTQAFPRERPRSSSRPSSGGLRPPRPVPATERELPQQDIVIASNAPSAQKLVTAPGWQPSFSEYRQLAATLLQANGDKPVMSLIVTSAMPGEGKTLTSANLALTLADAYSRRVLLVDADMRRPSLHALLGLPNGPGLGECLRAGRLVPGASVEIGKGFTLLPAGRPERDPVGQLSGPRFKEFFDEASKQFDCIVFDTPPAVMLPDAELIASVVQTVLLVVQAGKTAYQTVERAVASLGRERIAGVVLNQMAPDAQRSTEYREYYARFHHGNES